MTRAGGLCACGPFHHTATDDGDDIARSFILLAPLVRTDGGGRRRRGGVFFVNQAVAMEQAVIAVSRRLQLQMRMRRWDGAQGRQRRAERDARACSSLRRQGAVDAGVIARTALHSSLILRRGLPFSGHQWRPSAPPSTEAGLSWRRSAPSSRPLAQHNDGAGGIRPLPAASCRAQSLIKSCGIARLEPLVRLAHGRLKLPPLRWSTTQRGSRNATQLPAVTVAPNSSRPQSPSDTRGAGDMPPRPPKSFPSLARTSGSSAPPCLQTPAVPHNSAAVHSGCRSHHATRMRVAVALPIPPPLRRAAATGWGEREGQRARESAMAGWPTLRGCDERDGCRARRTEAI